MATIRHDPFLSLFGVSDPLRRSFERERELAEMRTESFERTWTPPVDIYEDKDAITLKVELPEVEAKDVELQLEGNTLTLKGERKLEKSDTREGYSRVERWYGSFVRSFTLPSSVDVEHVGAESKDGVLKIVLPKKLETRPRQIKVGTGTPVPGPERH